MNSIARSALNPEPQALAFPVLLALILHLLVASMFVCAGMFTPDKPLVDPDQAMEVSMMVLPKSASNMPEKAQHRPQASRQVPTEQPKAAVATGDVKPTEPPPVRESDLALHKPDAEKAEGKKRDQDLASEREKALRQMLMDDAMADLDTPEGPTDRKASDPDSTSDEAINATGLGNRADPEYARYISQIEKLFMQHFKPLPAIVAANPGLKARMHVMVDPTGRVTGFELIEPSGNPSFDGSANAAAMAVSTVPLPPEKYLHLMESGYFITFKPQ